MGTKHSETGHSMEEQLAKHKNAISALAQTGDARQLMALLRRQGGVQEAAKAAAGGNPAQLLAMMQELMKSGEGAALVDRLENQVRQAGLDRN